MSPAARPLPACLLALPLLLVRCSDDDGRRQAGPSFDQSVLPPALQVFWEEHPRLTTSQLAGGWQPPVAAHVPPAVHGIMQRCWQQDPRDRPSMYVVVALLEIAAECCRVAAGAAAGHGTARLLQTASRAQPVC